MWFLLDLKLHTQNILFVYKKSVYNRAEGLHIGIHNGEWRFQYFEMHPKKAAPSPVTVKVVGKPFPVISWLDIGWDLGWFWVCRRLISHRQHWEGMSPDNGAGQPVRAAKWGHLIADAASLTASLTGSYLCVLSETRPEHIFISPPLYRTGSCSEMCLLQADSIWHHCTDDLQSRHCGRWSILSRGDVSSCFESWLCDTRKSSPHSYKVVVKNVCVPRLYVANNSVSRIIAMSNSSWKL